jgi:hypothetical protein
MCGRPEELGAEAVIPSKRNLFCRIEDLGRIVPRKCKTLRSYAGLVSLAFALINTQLCPQTLNRCASFRNLRITT